MWLLLVPAILYLALLAAIYLAQTAMVFPARSAGGTGPLPPAAERLVLEIADGERLHGVRIPAGTGAGAGTLILGFGGNAWNAEHAAAYLREVYPGAEIVAFHYRGYAPSTGSPSAAALLADSERIYDHVVQQLRPARVVAVGFSLGSGVAARLTGRRPLAGTILVTPFDSLRRVAGQHYPWLPVRLLFRHEMPAAEDLRSSAVPTAVIAAQHDTIIPPARTEALRRALPNSIFDRTIAGTGHNDIYDRPEFRAAMSEALTLIERGRPKRG